MSAHTGCAAGSVALHRSVAVSWSMVVTVTGTASPHSAVRWASHPNDRFLAFSQDVAASPVAPPASRCRRQRCKGLLRTVRPRMPAVVLPSVCCAVKVSSRPAELARLRSAGARAGH